MFMDFLEACSSQKALAGPNVNWVFWVPKVETVGPLQGYKDDLIFIDFHRFSLIFSRAEAPRRPWLDRM